ncbi:MAG TPA: methanogenesis marker protein 11 [Methanospirillum sp.]|uniref:methanogenesis marker protein 11 n=1 Tax=Methanospirillum sp. TaxID=45200 RepID=UPI002C245A31|nr:methanogenesis marker protein 11 [Methanospirillum sp.]HWQ63062.1 methanogenesis marker protein 11 [Methanospirillum sp.]
MNPSIQATTGELSSETRSTEVNLVDPYIIHYPWITALASEDGSKVELIECFDCIGGAMWVKKHYAKSPLVTSVRTVGSMNRYILKTGSVDLNLEGSRFPAGICAVRLSDSTIQISYRGMGGGGVGATICRATAAGVISSEYDESGGGKVAGSTLTFARNTRVLIGVDDTDTPEQGATWTLVHNIARAVAGDPKNAGPHRYLSHTIVQLFPVPFRTKNCVGVVAEFASTNPQNLIDRFAGLLKKYTLSEKTGMAVYTGFSPDILLAFGEKVKRGQVEPDEAGNLEGGNLQIIMNGRGITGAIAAIPFYTRYDEALELYGP